MLRAGLRTCSVEIWHSGAGVSLAEASGRMILGIRVGIGARIGIIA